MASDKGFGVEAEQMRGNKDPLANQILPSLKVKQELNSLWSWSSGLSVKVTAASKEPQIPG